LSSRLIWLSIVSLVACAAGVARAADKKAKLADLSCEELFATGKSLLARGKRSDARTYLRRYEQRCPRGPEIEQAKLAIAKSFFDEGQIDLKVEGVATCRQIISFYPKHLAACECQLRIADYHFQQIRACDRDQSETREAVSEYEKLLAAYPDCEHLEEGRKNLAAARDRLACAEFEVARYYKRTGDVRSAEHRLSDLLRDFPEYSRGCEAARLRVELLAEIDDLEPARKVLAWMSEKCPGSEHLLKARRMVGVAPVLESNEARPR